MGTKVLHLRAFTHARILTPETEIADGTLIAEGRTIRAVGSSSAAEVPPGAERVDCSGKILVPGFIDIHVHGGGGHDVSNSDGLVGAVRFHAASGTTSWLPTVSPASVSHLKDQLSLLSRGYGEKREEPLPEILGLNVEGPFLNPKRKGVFAEQSLARFEPGVVQDLSAASSGTLRMMSLAPEIPAGMDLIREVGACGIIPCLGHSDATYEQAMVSFDKGVRHATHLFNAMKGFHHRDPGCAMAALLHSEVSVEMIVDGHHLHKGTVQMIHRLKGADRVILVTDASPLAGLEEREVQWMGQQITVRDGRSVDEQGTLAGSLLTMQAAVQQAVNWAGIPLKEAVAMASLNPARFLGVADRKGRLIPGADADLVILDASLKVEAVYIRGAAVGPARGSGPTSGSATGIG